MKDIEHKTIKNALAKKISAIAALATFMSLMLSQFVFAGGITINPETFKDDADAAGAMGGLIGTMLTIARYVGGGLAIWGGIMFGLAVKNEEAESKQKAIMTTIAGIFLIAIKSIATAMGLIG